MSYSCSFSLNQTQVYITLFYPCVSMITTTHCISRPQSLLGAWARGPGGSGDTGFEVLDFRTSGHFWSSTKFLIAFTCSCRSVNDCKFTWFKAFKRESSNLLLNQKWPEVLKYRTSNPVSPETPGRRAQAPRRLWGRECTHRYWDKATSPAF